jgi:hypothetical protein
MTYQPAGTYALERFELRSLTDDRGQGIDPRSRGFGQQRVYDLKNLVHTFNIYESMLNASVRGSATIYDTVGVFYNMPLVGQEILEIEYTDTKGVTHTDKFFVYSITDIKPAKSGADDFMEYKLHFTSFGKFWSDRYVIKRCIANGFGPNRQYLNIDEQVQILFEDYYTGEGQGTEKSIYISPTKGKQVIVIPYLKPEDAMHLFSRKAASDQFEGHLFRFWENRKQYFFADYEDWFTFGSKDLEYDTQLFFYNSGPTDNTPEGELAKLQNIISLDFGESINTIDAMNKGAYYRKYIELDLLTRSTYSYDYQHKDEFRNRVYPDGEGDSVKLVHSDQFIDEHLNKWTETYGIKDYADADINNNFGLRPHTYYGDIYNNKNALLWHYGHSKITARIYGTNEVFAGSIIQIDGLPQFVTGAVIPDQDRTGKFLVESASNEFVENTYIQTLTLIKGGLRS